MNPLHAVLRPPHAERFVRRFGLVESELEVDFDGWHKRVILSPRSAFLFPRYDSDVAPVRREALALEALADVDLVPRLIGLWDEPEICPYPFLETERRFGVNYASVQSGLSLDDVGSVLERLGSATATWHEIKTDGLPNLLRSPPESAPWTDRALDPATLRSQLEETYESLARVLPSDVSPSRSWIDAWDAMLAPLAAVQPVMTHGDIHEAQLLVDDDGELEVVLDWDHSGLADPVRDFNFGEWGFGIFAFQERFDELYRRYWDAYRARRAAGLPDHRSLLLLRMLSDAHRFCERLRASPASWFAAHRLRQCAEHVCAVTRSVS